MQSKITNQRNIKSLGNIAWIPFLHGKYILEIYEYLLSAKIILSGTIFQWHTLHNDVNYIEGHPMSLFLKSVNFGLKSLKTLKYATINQV